MSTHCCGGCGRYTAVVSGRAMDHEADGFTPSAHPHVCGPNGRLHVCSDGCPYRATSPGNKRGPGGAS